MPEAAQREFDKVRARGAALRRAWQQVADAFRATQGDLADAFDRAMAGALAPHWDARLPRFTPEDGNMATGDAGEKVTAVLAEAVPNLVGGSADLDPSTRTMMKGKGDFQSADAPREGQTPPTQGPVDAARSTADVGGWAEPAASP